MKKSSVRTVKDRTKARSWMVDNHIRQRDIQLSLGHQYPVQVSETMRGVRSNRAVLEYLLDKGCPGEYLALPLDILEVER
jgi:hypothetical protein